MIDFHSHVLPGMDDGSPNTDTSMKMLELMRLDGIDTVIATPHFYGERESMDSFLKRRNVCVQHLKRKYDSEQFPKIAIGAEVAYFEGISKAEDLNKLCIAGTNLLLLEMPFCNWNERIFNEVKKLAGSKDFHLILAHIERYPSYQKRDSYFEDVLGLDVTCQCNAGPLLSWSKRKQVLRYFESGQAKLLGSDCHNLESRKPNLGEGRKILEKKLGKNILDRIDADGKDLIKQYSIDGFIYI